MSETKRVTLACGCTAHGTLNGVPGCGVHRCIEQVSPPDLTGRNARCSCLDIKPSSIDLPFFEFRGEGSQAAITSCVHCGYHEVAHSHDNGVHRYHGWKSVIDLGRCKGFTARGPWEFDSFYCGHAGWD